MITMKENMCGSVNTRCLQSIASICSVKLFVLFSTEIASICSIKLFLLFSTEISSTEYRDVSYVQYQDVLISDIFRLENIWEY